MRALIQLGKDRFPASGSIYSAYEGFLHLGYDIEYFTLEDTFTKTWLVNSEVPVIGTARALYNIWRSASMRGPTPIAPKPIDYPSSLNKYLGRDITSSTLQKLHSKKTKTTYPVFIKPKNEYKLFEGQVVTNPKEVDSIIQRVGKDKEIWLSKKVNFQTEYRVFVFNGEIKHISHYSGNPYLCLKAGEVSEIVDIYVDSPCAYALDLGIVGHRVCLVEVNDFFYIGPYTLPSTTYAEMLSARWREIVDESL